MDKADETGCSGMEDGWPGLSNFRNTRIKVTGFRFGMQKRVYFLCLHRKVNLNAKTQRRKELIFIK